MSIVIGILSVLCLILAAVFIVNQKGYKQLLTDRVSDNKESSCKDKDFYIKATRRYLNYNPDTDGEVLTHISKYSSTNIYCYILYVIHSNKNLHGASVDNYKDLYEELNSVTTADKTIFKYLGTYEMKNPRYKEKSQ